LLSKQIVALHGKTVRLATQPSQLILELLDARALHLGCLGRTAQLPVEGLPRLLPLGQPRLRDRKPLGCRLLFRPRALHFRREPCQLRTQLGNLLRIALEVASEFRKRRLRLRVVSLLPLARFAQILDLLLRATDISTDTVVAGLSRRHQLVLLHLKLPLRFDGSLG